MDDVLAELTSYPVNTRMSLSGTADRRPRHRARQDQGTPRPRRGHAEYLKVHPVYYAGPAKTPEGYASGSFGPTTAGRMDAYVEQFQAAGGSKVMLAKGNRSQQVTEACGKHGGFYLGSIGGPAARLAQDCIKKVEVLEYEELGMEAVWRIEVEDFPAFIVVDDKGNDFFQDPAPAPTFTSIPVRRATDGLSLDRPSLGAPGVLRRRGLFALRGLEPPEAAMGSLTLEAARQAATRRLGLRGVY